MELAGAAAYVTFVEHPARVSGGTAPAIEEFRPSYRRGTVMQASLAALGLVAAVLGWAASRDIGILVAGLLLGSAISFTLLVISADQQETARRFSRSFIGLGCRSPAAMGAPPRGPDDRGLAAFALLLARLAR